MLTVLRIILTAPTSAIAKSALFSLPNLRENEVPDYPFPAGFV
jgi:hypothetical protein